MDIVGESDFVCKECAKSDRLYSDSHGIFCGRCGPGVPVISRTALRTLDKRLEKPGKAGDG